MIEEKETCTPATEDVEGRLVEIEYPRMKEELFAELMDSAEEALSHAKGKRELRTTVLPVPPAPMPKAIQRKTRAALGNRKAWVLIGRSGEYSDAAQWTVAVYLDKAAAEAEMDRLNALAEDSAKNGRSWEEYCENREVVKARLLPHDPQVSFSYTGVWYELDETDLREP